MIVISFCNSLGQSFCEDVCNTNTTRILSSRNVVSNHQAYIDTIIRNTSLAMTIAEGDSDDEDESEMESDPDTDSGDDVDWESSQSGSDGVDVDEGLLPEIGLLEISYNKDFIDHDTEIGDHELTNTECVDMDISSPLVCRTIETDILTTSIEGGNPPTTLLHHGYDNTFADGLEQKLNLVKDHKFVCSLTKLKELFSFCMDSDCKMALIEVREKFIGCTVEIRWRCKAGHCGCWQSSKLVNNVYVNNIQTAAAILFSGNNFAKVSLLAKCLHLAFFSSSTFLNYQKKYLSKAVHEVEWYTRYNVWGDWK